MQKERRKRLAGRLAFSYTLIALVPIMLLVFLAAYAMALLQIEAVIESANNDMDTTHSRVSSMLDSVARLETAFQMRSDLISMIASPETDWDSYATVSQYLDEVTEVERELFLVDIVDSQHLFVFNNVVPERWPTVLHADRYGMEDAESGWNFNTLEVSNSVSLQTRETMVSHSVLMTHYARPYGMLQTSMALPSFLPEIYSLGTLGSQNDYAFIFTPEGSLERILPPDVSTESDSLSSDLLSRAAALAYEASAREDRGSVSMRSGLTNYTILYFIESGPSLLFIKICPVDQINRIFLVYFIWALVFTLVIMLLVIIVSLFMTRRQTRSLNMILDAMGEVARGDFTVPPPALEGMTSDVRDARDNFITLTGQLKDALVKMHEHERLLADTQIRAMQNQINVHFLINTVESIKMQAMLAGDSEVEHSLDMLGELFRYSLRWKERFVSLSKELDYISTYVELMNYRYDYTVTCINNVDISFSELQVPKMILQPIVENAFKYSFDLTGKDGTIIIESEERDECVMLKVTNDGTPMDEERRQAVLDYLSADVPEREGGRGSIGLKNIQMRLFMFYGEDYSIEIGYDEDGRTVIAIPIGKEAQK